MDTTDSFDEKLVSILAHDARQSSESLAKQLQKKGGELVLPPEGFYVGGTEGPLLDGELERAGAWGKRIIMEGTI